VLEEPHACVLYSVFHAVLVPFVCGILSALGETEQLKTLILLVGQYVLDCVLLDLKLLLRNVTVHFCNFLEACVNCIS
jgi:hypothetical protein